MIKKINLITEKKSPTFWAVFSILLSDCSILVRKLIIIIATTANIMRPMTSIIVNKDIKIDVFV